MQTVKATILILIYTTLLAACGLKGPLYISNEGPPPTEHEAGPATDKAESKEEAEADKENNSKPD